MTAPVVAASLILVAMAACHGQTGFPMIGCALPVGIERGKTTDVKVTLHAGNSGTPGNWNGAYKALFQGEGVTAEIVPPEKGWPAPDPKTPDVLPPVREVTMRVTAAANAEIGIREFRIATAKQGVSTVGYLLIAEESDILETEPNDPAAQPINVPCAVSGRIQQGEDSDLYKFSAQAGQTVTFSVLSTRLQEKIHDLEDRADLRIVLRDSARLELTANDDFYRADPLINYRFEKAGEYTIQVRDTRYKGSAAWAYRLSVSTGPLINAVFPPVARPGENVELNLIGFNLPVQTARIQIPSDRKAGEWITRIPIGDKLSNPVKLMISDVPESVALPAATAADGSLVLPGGVSSWLKDSRQVHRYKFKAKRGEAWEFEVKARRLGSDMDSEIRIKDSNGNVHTVNDDSGGKDSLIQWGVPADGEFTLEVRGVDNAEGPGAFYNVSARPMKPEFRLRCDMDRTGIAPGNRTTWYVLVERRHGFAGPVKIEVEGLPSGIQALPLTIPPEVSVGTLFLSAAPDCMIDSSLVRVVGSAEVLGAVVRKEAGPLGEVYVPGGGRSMPQVSTQAVSITQPNDLEVSVNATTVSLAPGGTAKIEVTLKRRPGYNKPVTLDVSIQHLGSVYANPLPPGVTVDDGASKTLLGEGEVRGHVTLRAAPDAKPIANLPIGIMANASVNFVMKTWYSSPPILLTVSPAKSP